MNFWICKIILVDSAKISTWIPLKTWVISKWPPLKIFFCQIARCFVWYKYLLKLPTWWANQIWNPSISWVLVNYLLWPWDHFDLWWKMPKRSSDWPPLSEKILPIFRLYCIYKVFLEPVNWCRCLVFHFMHWLSLCEVSSFEKKLLDSVKFTPKVAKMSEYFV